MLKILTIIVVFIAFAYYYVQHRGNSVRRKPQELNHTYDYVIVGGGTAGCVLAGRLSEDPSVTVLLLEAGPEEDYLWYSHVPGMAAHLLMTDLDWTYMTEPQKYCCNSLREKQVRWPRGKGLGGSSIINYMNFVRCSPKDYDYWADLGNPGWSYQDVLPYFKKLERNEISHLKGRNDLHGYDGPIMVNEGDRTPVGKAVASAVKRKGYRFSDDMNGNEFEGFSWVQFNVDKQGRRISTAKAYLRPAMGRHNLHVLVKAHVSKVLMEQRSEGIVATGVQYLFNDRKYAVHARKEVIVSGGAVNSPQILMLSGIGPKKQLEDLSIPVLVDNPAVGANLDDHVAAFVHYTSNASGLNEAHLLNTWSGYLKAMGQYYILGQGPLSRTPTEITGFIRTGLLPGEWPDVQLYLVNVDAFIDDVINLTPEASRNRKSEKDYIFYTVGAVHLHPSDKGEIRLRSVDPLTHPIIEHHYFKTATDIDVLVKGLRVMIDILENSTDLKPFDIRYAETGPVPGCEKYKPLSEQYLKCSVRSRGMTLYHPVGTCRMGQKGNNSVVDHKLRVHGVDRLRVVDASVFPHQLSGNTHVPTVMVAEKAADMIKEAAV